MRPSRYISKILQYDSSRSFFKILKGSTFKSDSGYLRLPPSPYPRSLSEGGRWQNQRNTVLNVYDVIQIIRLHVTLMRSEQQRSSSSGGHYVTEYVHVWGSLGTREAEQGPFPFLLVRRQAYDGASNKQSERYTQSEMNPLQPSQYPPFCTLTPVPPICARMQSAEQQILLN